jgi:bacillithiol biosynthesis cysteine-adding enzyme BshC
MHIPFQQIESIPKLIKDFLAQEIPGFEHSVFNLENIEKQINLKLNSFSKQQREILAEVFQAQHSPLPKSAKQQRNLETLIQGETFTVTTGHQLNLFSGPVFFIYKILQTIKLADSLNASFPDRKIIPVFWMATEDHDFEEIDHFSTQNNFYQISGQSGGPVGRIKIENTDFISQFEAEFRDAPLGEELITLLKKTYKKGRSLAEATRTLVQELFADFGLLILDGDDAKLKMQMKALFKAELTHHTVFETTKETISSLTERYGKVQVNPREINLFYLSETRDRIEFSDHQFHIVDKNRAFSEEEILSELEEFPERFSPNALLRPVFQEVVLPNLAYIGGNAEIMYWLELKDYFKSIQIPFPLLIPRASFLFLEEKIFDKTQALGLETEDLLRDFTMVSKKVLLENHEILNLLQAEEKALIEQFDQLAAISRKTDPTFGNMVEAEKTRQLKSFQRLEKRLLRAEKRKQAEKLERLENLFQKVHPGNKWQERSLNFSVFYSVYGLEWLQNCYREIDVYKSELIILSI